MVKVSPAVLASVRGTGIARALRTLNILEQTNVKGAAGIPWRNALAKEFGELTYKQTGELYQIARSAREAIALTKANKFSRAQTGSVIPVIENLDFPSRARGRIRYQLLVEINTPYGKRPKYTNFNVYSNTPLGFDTLMNRAQSSLEERMEASPGLKMGVRATASVQNITLQAIVSR